MASAKYIRELKRVMEGAGFRVLQVTPSKKHLRFTLEHQGIVRLSFTAGTPSDRRSVLNWVSEVRRDFRQFSGGTK